MALAFKGVFPAPPTPIADEGRVHEQALRALLDVDGREVFITLTCPTCKVTKPLSAFGLRRMGDGKIRNAPWCKRCRARSVPIRIVVEEVPHAR